MPVGCVRFARNCGKMYSRHLYWYVGLAPSGLFQGIIIVHFIIGGKGVVRVPKKKVT